MSQLTRHLALRKTKLELRRLTKTRQLTPRKKRKTPSPQTPLPTPTYLTNYVINKINQGWTPSTTETTNYIVFRKGTRQQTGYQEEKFTVRRSRLSNIGYDNPLQLVNDAKNYIQARQGDQTARQRILSRYPEIIQKQSLHRSAKSPIPEGTKSDVIDDKTGLYKDQRQYYDKRKEASQLQYNIQQRKKQAYQTSKLAQLYHTTLEPWTITPTTQFAHKQYVELPKEQIKEKQEQQQQYQQWIKTKYRPYELALDTPSYWQSLINQNVEPRTTSRPNYTFTDYIHNYFLPEIPEKKFKGTKTEFIKRYGKRLGKNLYELAKTQFYGGIKPLYNEPLLLTPPWNPALYPLIEKGYDHAKYLFNKYYPETARKIDERLSYEGGKIYTDPEVRQATIMGGLTAIGATSPIGAWAIKYGILPAMAVPSVSKTIRDPTQPEHWADTTLYALPYMKHPKTLLGKIPFLRDKTVIIADKGELVPLRSRIQQLTEVFNQKKITMLTARRTIFGNRPTNVPKTWKQAKEFGWNKEQWKKLPKDEKGIPYDNTYGNEGNFGTYDIGGVKPTSKIFLEKWLNIGKLVIKDTKVHQIPKTLYNNIMKDLLKTGRTNENNIKLLYENAKEQANKTKKPVATISPKRLRGFKQAEQELVEILPDNYKQPTLKPAGFTPNGNLIFTNQKIKAILKTRLADEFLAKNKINEYWKSIAEQKLKHLKDKTIEFPEEYGMHGKEHLLKYEEIDPYYKYHDITKVGDVDSFTKYPHGPTAGKLLKEGILKDKEFLKLPKHKQAEIAEAISGHEYYRPTIKTLFEKPKGGITIPSTRQAYYWYRGKYNPTLRKYATWDKIDLSRLGITPNKKFFAPEFIGKQRTTNAIIEKRLFSTARIINKTKFDKIIKEFYNTKPTKQNYKNYLKEYTKLQKIRKATKKYLKQKKTQTTYKESYTQKPTYKQLYKKTTSYTQPYKKTIGYTTPYEKRTPYIKPYEEKYTEIYTPYTPTTTTTTTYTPPTKYGGTTPKEKIPPITKITEKTGTKTTKKINETKQPIKAYQPIYYTKNNKKIFGKIFRTQQGATSEAMKTTDKTPIHKFSIRQILLPKNKEYLRKKGTGNKIQHKFYTQKNQIIEKTKYRKDTKGETSFDWMKHLK